jgi:hypothetical protein
LFERASACNCNVQNHGSVTEILMVESIEIERGGTAEVSKLHSDGAQHGMRVRVVSAVRGNRAEQMVGGQRHFVKYVHSPKICSKDRKKLAQCHRIHKHVRAYHCEP